MKASFDLTPPRTCKPEALRIYLCMLHNLVVLRHDYNNQFMRSHIYADKKKCWMLITVCFLQITVMNQISNYTSIWWSSVLCVDNIFMIQTAVHFKVSFEF